MKKKDRQIKKGEKRKGEEKNAEEKINKISQSGWSRLQRVTY